jgi:hypothetical protein
MNTTGDRSARTQSFHFRENDQFDGDRHVNLHSTSLEQKRVILESKEISRVLLAIHVRFTQRRARWKQSRRWSEGDCRGSQGKAKCELTPQEQFAPLLIPSLNPVE